MMTPSNLSAQYQLSGVIHESVHSMAWRAVRTRDHLPVILKILKDAYPPIPELARYRKEYEYGKLLKDLPGIGQVLGMETFDNRLALILEDSGADSLQVWLDRGRRFELEEVLWIGSNVAGCLRELHARNIVHKDIKPGNVLYHSGSRATTLIDFGISAVVPRDNPSYVSTQALEGTLAYIAPEQTGRTNYSMDYRADFYALGVTLYQLATDSLPFDEPTPEILIQCHVRHNPAPPRQRSPSIPVVVSDIVMKLMAKDPNDRYQSAAGLQADLDACLERWDAFAEIPPFPLAQKDRPLYLMLPQQLYGRQAQTKLLLEALGRAGEGQRQMVLVSGYSGIGKTVFIRQIAPPLLERAGYFFQGKFDPLQRERPYSAFIDALRQLLVMILTAPEARFNEWKEKIKAALGPNGGVLVELIPDLEKIIGKQPAIPDLPPKERQNRFHFVFQSFIRVFASREHPLVLFLDDLQWADLASLRLIRLLLDSAEIEHFYLIGAYRDNEVGPAHPLRSWLVEAEKGRVVRSISLGPLSRGDIPARERRGARPAAAGGERRAAASAGRLSGFAWRPRPAGRRAPGPRAALCPRPHPGRGLFVDRRGGKARASPARG